MILLCLPICWFRFNLIIFSCLDNIISFFENIWFLISLSKPIQIDGLSSLEALNLLKIFWVVYILLEFLIAEVILKENRSILFEQIKFIKQLKCVKYLWIGEKIEKEVNGEDRCIGAWRTAFLRSGRRGWLRWAWWVHAWEGEGRAESYLCLELWWYEVGVIVLVLSLMKRVVAFAIKSWAWCDFSLIVGPSNVYLFTKMSWKLSFHNLKTLKICFQFC